MRILSLLSLLLLSCNPPVNQTLLEHIHDDSTQIILFVPDPYCEGCLTRSLHLIRSFSDDRDYLIVSTKINNPWLQDGEKFKVISKESYISSLEYDYLIYIWIKDESSVWKQKLATDKDLSSLKTKFETMDSANL